MPSQLPTRLLDITSNPLIALYFACVSDHDRNLDKAGQVISFSLKKDEIKYFDSDEVSFIANLARLNSSERREISRDMITMIYCNGIEFKDFPAVKKLNCLIMEEKPFYDGKINPEDLQKIVCLKGKKSNNRISAQSGAFLLFGLDSRLSEEGNEGINRIIVEDKKKILKELDLLNINESTVFPYIENSAKYIRKKYSFNKTEARLETEARLAKL